MAFVDIPGGLWIPAPFVGRHDDPAPSSDNTFRIDAAGERIAFIFRVPKTGTLDKFEWHSSDSTLNAASVLRLSFQNVDLATGFPDATQDQFRDQSTLTSFGWNAPGLMTSDGTDTGTKRSVTVDDLLAAVIEFQTFTAADSVRWRKMVTPYSFQGIFGAFPYPASFFASVWATVAETMPFMALKYSDGTYAQLNDWVLPAGTGSTVINTTTFNNGSTPDERGLFFQLPAPVKVGGAWWRADLDGNADYVLYDSDGTTVLASSSLDLNVRGAAKAGNFFIRHTPISLTASTNYRAVIKPTSVTNLSTYDFDVNAAALLDAVAGGQNWHYTSRTDAGAWTQVTTKRPFMGLLVTAIDDGAGASGGGMRLAGRGGLASGV